MKMLSTHRAFVGHQHFLVRRWKCPRAGSRAGSRAFRRGWKPMAAVDRQDAGDDLGDACSCRSRCRRRWRGSRPAAPRRSSRPARGSARSTSSRHAHGDVAWTAGACGARAVIRRPRTAQRDCAFAGVSDDAAAIACPPPLSRDDQGLYCARIGRTQEELVQVVRSAPQRFGPTCEPVGAVEVAVLLQSPWSGRRS